MRDGWEEVMGPDMYRTMTNNGERLLNLCAASELMGEVASSATRTITSAA